MSTIIQVNHDSGPPVSAHWDNIIDTTSRLTITSGSALGGSANGLNIATVTGNAVSFGDRSISAPASNEINLRIRVNFDPLTITGSQILLTVNIPSTFATEVLSIQVQAAAGVIQARANWQDDVPVLFSSAWVNISGETCLECSVIRNGVGVFKINGAIQHTTAALANSGQFDGMNFLLFTANAVAAVGTSGAFYLDELVLDDAATSKLCSNFDIITHGRGASSLLFNQQAAPTLDGQFCLFVVEDTAAAQIRYIKMDVPVEDDLTTTMTEVQTDAADTDGMVGTTKNADKMLFAGDDSGGGFVEKHIVSTRVTTDLYSNATTVQALTASPNSDEESLIEESVAGAVRHTIDDFGASTVTVNFATSPAFFDASIAALFSKNPDETTMRDMQAWVVGLDTVVGDQFAFFIQLMTGADMVANDEAIAALQNAALITGVGIGR
jgi:hypothetical protein